MEILDENTLRKRDWEHPVISIGNFDGVHLGHRSIIERVVERARKENCRSVALTFEPHPKVVLHHTDSPPRLTLPEERNRLLGELSLDALVVIEPTVDFLRQSPDEFIRDVVVGALNARAIVEGPDFRFGYDSAGDLAALQEMGKTYGFDVVEVQPVFCDGRMVSSTMIRSLLRLGQVDLAAKALGRRYAVSREVCRGKGRGRELGFPTINLTLPPQMLPHAGVYVVEVAWDGGSAFGMAFLGRRLTFKEASPIFEVHLFDFDGELYGRTVTVSFLHHLRDEEAFDSHEELRQQLTRDLEDSRRYLAEHSSVAK
jgi:riboflavin kinase/FMN adenylyltransferase